MHVLLDNSCTNWTVLSELNLAGSILFCAEPALWRVILCFEVVKRGLIEGKQIVHYTRAQESYGRILCIQSGQEGPRSTASGQFIKSWVASLEQHFGEPLVSYIPCAFKIMALLPKFAHHSQYKMCK